MSKITHNTVISLGIVMTLVGIVFSAGILYNKVDTNQRELTEFKTDTKAQLATLNQKVDSLINLRSSLISSTDSTPIIP